MNRFSTGKGTNIINEILLLYNKQFKQNIHYKIVDLKDNNKPVGTLVKITIPLKNINHDTAKNRMLYN